MAGPVALFLSGPMRGHRMFNFPAFHEARILLERAGYAVACPAARDLMSGFDPVALDLHGNHSELAVHGFSVPDAMLWCCTMICLHVDGVALLPGWVTSAGARTEWHLAQALGLPCNPITEWLDLAEAHR